MRPAPSLLVLLLHAGRGLSLALPPGSTPFNYSPYTRNFARAVSAHRARCAAEVNQQTPKCPQQHKFQNTKFELAQLATEIAVTGPFMDQCLMKLNDGALTPTDAAMAKLWGTQLQNRVTDHCLQLFGGYGFMNEYPISRAWVDARVCTIYGGTSEIMKTIISKEVLA